MHKVRQPTAGVGFLDTKKRKPKKQNMNCGYFYNTSKDCG